MTALTTLTGDADGTIGLNTVNNVPDTPIFDHCNDTPDGGSADWVANDQGEKTTTFYCRLTDVNSDFGSMDTLTIDVDLDAVDDGSSDDNLTLDARIADDNDSVTFLTDSQQIGDETDGTRVQRELTFGSLTGTKAQWNTAHILFTWTYSKTGAGDNNQIRLYGFKVEGTYTISSGVSTPIAMRYYRQMRTN